MSFGLAMYLKGLGVFPSALAVSIIPQTVSPGSLDCSTSMMMKTTAKGKNATSARAMCIEGVKILLFNEHQILLAGVRVGPTIHLVFQSARLIRLDRGDKGFEHCDDLW